MEFNWIMVFAAALIPLVVGAVYYHPKVLGNAWMRASGLTEESLKGGNMALIFGLTYLFSLMLGVSLTFMVIHQAHLYSTVLNEPGFNDPNSEVGRMISSFMEKYGSNFRTFKHGALHGVLTGVFVALPIIGINALFERKSFKYIAIHTGYWVIALALMGGVLCAYM
ncbi:MAG: DUF1761 domain-containing protein [Saprospirales bacterium]|nr:DUF1761 domain-containing protein [Saprospirales bacterium]MBK8920735.1 DUF1761 domain-containing protein [Saprospirales bacterium]